MARLLPYLTLLACPLMMLFCMRGMRGMGQQQTQAEPKPEQSTNDQRIAQLEREVADLRLERELADLRLERELADLQAGQQPPTPVDESPAGPPRTGRADRPS